MNLRGEYHTENVTTFDELPKRQDNSTEMDIDSSEKPTQKPNTSEEPMDTSPEADGSKGKPKDTEIGDKSAAAPPDMDTLYSIFWSLQSYFSYPIQLFDSTNFASFKTGLQHTLSIFQRVNTDLEVRTTSRGQEESRRGPKRRKVGDSTETNSFNPKYLTSRDLFELEVIYLLTCRYWTDILTWP